MKLVITAWGHPNIRSQHQSTWQLTTEEYLSPRGDCIIGIRSSHAAADLPQEWKTYLQEGGQVKIRIIVGEQEILGMGSGHPDLTLTDIKDMVFRRSEYTCDRTVLINCDFTAVDLPQMIVEQLRDEQQVMKVELSSKK